MTIGRVYYEKNRAAHERDLARDATAWGAFRLISECVKGDPVRAGQLSALIQKVGMRKVDAEVAQEQVIRILYPGRGE